MKDKTGKKVHELKTWPEFFKAIKSGAKTCEIREDDRGFSVGDVLKLREFVPCSKCGGGGRVWGSGDMDDCGCQEPHGRYTGRSLQRLVTHILKGEQWGLVNGRVAMSIALCRRQKR